MDFEFDPEKSQANKAKHGIDFVEAQELWRDGNSYTVPGNESTESRWVAIALLNGKHWSSVYTVRGEIIRLISVRRARNSEVRLYEDNITRRI